VSPDPARAQSFALQSAERLPAARRSTSLRRGGERASEGVRARLGAHGWLATIGAGLFGVNLLFSRYLFGDSYLDLAAGRYIAAHGIPHREVFTLEGVGRPWIDQQWLAHWLYYQVWRTGGYALLAVFSSTLVVTGFVGLAALMTKRGVPPQRVVLWTALAYVACMGNTVIRAQSFAYPLLVFLLWTILADAQHRRFSWSFLLVLPALVLWSNLHGTVALGIVLACGYAGFRGLLLAVRRDSSAAVPYILVAALAPLTLFANPYGFRIVDYYRALVGNSVVRQYVIEWSRPSIANVFSWAFLVLVLIVAGVVVYAFAKRARPDPVLLGMTVALLALALQGVRYQAWFALGGALLAGETLAGVRDEPPELSQRMRRLGAAAVAIFATAAIGIVVQTPGSRFETLSPDGAIAATAGYVASHPTARVLADDDSSTALLWKEPILIGRVAFDARFEQFPQQRLRRWFVFFLTNEPTWKGATDGYDVILATRRSHPGLVRRLHRLRAWTPVYEDRKGAVFVRTAY
jgi:hypothetical protein